MSYLVLARKYRPQRFEDLVGQEHVSRTLTNAISLGRVHHAFLFTGARGVGKTSAARILAKALSCREGPTTNPCGVCELCQEIASGQSVDVLEIDGASNTGVDDVRTLREAARYLPARGRKKVYIIDEVHMLSTSAFNALLKTLEEPPPHVVFIFATTEVHKIPSTIMSRCQRYDFKLIPTTRLSEHLAGILGAETIAFEADGLRLLARQAAGSVRDALSLLDQVIAYVGDAPITRERVAEVLGVADRRLLFELAEAVLARDVARTLRTAGGAVDRGVDLMQLARAFLAHLHDLEVAGLVPDAADLIDATADELAEAQALARKAPRGLLGALFDRWARAVDEAGRSTVPRLILEMGLVDLCFGEPLLPLSDLLPRLEELESRLAGAPAAPPRSPEGGKGGGGARPPSAPSPSGAPRPVAPARLEPPSAPSLSGAPRPVAPARLEPLSALPGSPTEIAEAWRRVRETFGDRVMVAAALDHAEVLEWADGRVTLALPDRLTVEQAEKNKKEIERALAALTATPMTLTVKLGAPSMPAVLRSEVGKETDAAVADRARREREARQHPMVRKAQEVFNVTAREVRTP